MRRARRYVSEILHVLALFELRHKYLSSRDCRAMCLEYLVWSAFAAAARVGPDSVCLRRRARAQDLGVLTAPKEDLDVDNFWRLLLHNDDVHTFEYVTDMIMSTVPTVSQAKAHHMTMTTHTDGVSTVTQTVKELAQKYCMKLQMAGLTASISPDAGFEGGDEDGDGPDTA